MLRCRVCLGYYSESEVFAIDVDELDSNTLICEAFLQITAINISNLGEYKFICNICKDRLKTAFDFRVEAITSYEYLTKNNNVSEDEPLNVNIKVEKVDIFEKGDDGFWPEADTDVFYKCEPTFEVKDEKPINFGNQQKNTKKCPKPNKKKATKSRVRIDDGLNKSYCRFCLQYIGSKLGVHERQHIMENNGLQCHHCNKRYMKRRILLEHLLRVHFMDKENRPRYPCDLCEKTYTEKSAVRSHKKTAHFGLVKHIQEHVCTVCGKSQKGKYALEKHIDMVHNNIIIGYCNECNKGFKTKISLVNHLKFVHLKLRPYQCKICLKGYIHRLELKRHMTGVHTEERAFSCVTCNKKFKTEAILKNHLKLHTNDFSYPCQICGMTFKTLSYVKAHMKAHSDECFFFCKLCPKKFKRSGQLTKHMRLHTGNLFYCNQCTSNGFVDQFTLQEHIERVHIGVRYKCGSCDKEYGCRKHLRQHQNAQLHDRTKFTKIDPRKLQPLVG